MFALPAIALHYLAPRLAVGGGDTRAMFFPWLFELLLIGWMCLAAGWPILWQGGLALLTLRGSADVLTSMIVLAAFVPSAVGVGLLLVGAEPFYGSQGPAFHVAGIAMIFALAQRWLAYRNISRLAGRATLMLLRFGTLVGAWMIVATVYWLAAGWQAALAFALLLPPLASLGAINPWSPRWTSLLPTFAFALLVLMDPAVAGFSLGNVRIEVASGFALLQTLVMAAGWRMLGMRD
jgi:hypothetical protein